MSEPAAAPAAPMGPRADTRGLVGWAMYDWANSAFTTVVITFVFATYFARGVVGDETQGTAYWGYALSISGAAIAILAPIFGAIADKGGRRKPWIGGFTILCVVCTALLTLVDADPTWIVPALVLVGLANIGFEMGIVFYNAMLPDIVPPERVGRISGWAWGLGYGGGLVCLALILAFMLDIVQWTSLLVAVWFAVFALPLFLWTPDQPSTPLGIGPAVREGLAMLIGTLKSMRENANIARYLLAHMIYGDGLVTLFAMGGVFAQSAFGMTTNEVLQFAVAINIFAGIGATAFGWVDDRFGSKRTIQIALLSLSAIAIVILLTDDKLTFMALGCALGIFVGPSQAASRSLLARIVPEGKETEMFGLYALSGKATAFVGPAAFAIVTAAFDSARAGMATIPFLFLVGAALLATVSDRR